MTTRIDLSSLPFPNVLTTIDFDVELDALKADLITRYPSVAAALDLESEPLTKLLEVFAYRLILKSGEINANAKALMLAYASASDLDHLGANVDVYRLLVTPANTSTVPVTAAVYETDDAYRRRIQLAPERDAAGSTGAYQYWALSADGDVRDVAVITPSAGVVQVYVQSHTSAIAPQTLLDVVATTLDPNTRRPFTDSVAVLAASPQDFSVVAEMTLYQGPDAALVKANAEAALARYLQQVSYLGYDATRSGLFAALHQAGVQRVNLITPADDVVIANSHYGRCIAQTLSIVEYRNV